MTTPALRPRVRRSKKRPARTIASLMTKRPVTISEADDVGLARSIMLWSGIRHLPVIRQRRVIGVVSDRDLVEAVATYGPDASLQKIKADYRVSAKEAGLLK